ncbi:MAG TPA: hypothetical protein VFL13_11510, partial [Candidatus Baltobacteraceae bacterium]|nr:hypothetical protein [Candidatus Baltobacteraceae bacterium]
NAVHQIRAHVLDMLAATTRLLAALTAPTERTPAGEAYVRARVRSTLEMHAEDLREHLRVLGSGALSQAATQTFERRIPPAATIGDLFSRLSLVNAAALMLETNARAIGFSSTAALAARHREEIETLLAQLRELLPKAA